jgi:hypothetical protein
VIVRVAVVAAAAMLIVLTPAMVWPAIGLAATTAGVLTWKTP